MFRKKESVCFGLHLKCKNSKVVDILNCCSPIYKWLAINIEEIITCSVPGTQRCVQVVMTALICVLYFNKKSFYKT